MSKNDDFKPEKNAVLERLVAMFEDKQRFADLERLLNSVPRARSFAWTASQRQAVADAERLARAEGQAGPPTDRNAVRHVG